MNSRYEPTLYGNHKSESMKAVLVGERVRCVLGCGARGAMLLLLHISARPGLEELSFTLTVFVEGQISERPILDELLFRGVLDGKIVIGTPGAGVEVELVLFERRFTI